MQDYFEINVSKNGQHLFATAERSIPRYGRKLDEVLAIFREKFPESEGYDIIVTLWECRGKVVYGK